MAKRIVVNLLLILLAVLLVSGIAALLFLNTPAFGRLPGGERRQRIERSPNFRDGQFRNRQPTVMMTSERGRIRTMLGFLFRTGPERLRPESPVRAEKTDLRTLDPSKELLVWFGHSSYLIQTGGKRLLVDPVFCQAAPLSFLNEPFAGADVYSPDDMPDIDYLVITHDHWDHLDYRTVMRLKERIGRVVCPLGVGEHFEYWGFDPFRIDELDWDEQAEGEAGFTIRCLPARHFSGRGLRANRTLWASFLVQSPVQRIFIGGDGGYGDHFAQIGRHYPGIALAILENGQYNRDWQYIHMLPNQLALAAADLGAQKIITAHHSKYALARHAWDEPLENARMLAEKDSFDVLMPTIGAVVAIAPQGTPTDSITK